MDNEFSLNVNKISNDVKVVAEPPRMESDEDIYDLRRQIEARQVVKDYLRTEILRLQQLMEQMTREIIGIDLKLRDRKPAGEPKNRRFLYAPDSTYQLEEGEAGAVDAEIIE
jgi:hypothetical protein